ncbi:dolichyl-diphosphooligosaccharide--protein glycosyltransferase subunit 2-like [Pocillopora damicornis]|uniref:dolichyl-diphosphooligosaccharide--protein glycosyltransferase subunit 2-like n=1 Tax=Pocillopora damicornis TaxID=46731 RepID=UPI000F556767|nr:dolichyl-diphosphooligosaccharide--protein glycosyltransferase subunit 2-like [Pocillopora damicornis]
MAARGACLLVVLAFVVCTSAISLSSVLSIEDQVRFKQTFYNAIPFKDLKTATYSIIGLKLMKAEIPPTQDVCKFAKDNIDSSSVTSIFYAATIKFLANCKFPAGQGVEATLSSAAKEGTDMRTLYYAVAAQSYFGLKVDTAEVLKAVKAAINSDEDSILGAAYALLTATHLPKDADVSFITDLIEDTVAQADEVDNSYLQFEAGLLTTSKVVYAIYLYSEQINKAPAITEEQVIKFTNYLLTRKHVQSVEDSCVLFSALDKLGNNAFHVPVVFQFYGSPVVSEDNKMVKVRVTNVMDKAFGKMTVTGTSAEDAEGTTVLSNKVFSAGPDNYELNFMTSRPGPGVYTISISAKPHKEDKRLLGATSGQVKVKVVTKVTVEDVELSVVDKEQNIKAKTLSVKHPEAIGSVIEADYHQKVVMKFSLKSSSSGDLFTPHQAFVRLTNQKTNQEIFFVAEPEQSKVFKFDLDVGATAKDSFGSLSGKYKMDLIVGDAVIQNPFEWNVGVLSLTFNDDPTKPGKDKENMYHAKPEIEHMFRIPEKRPPKAVSTAFTALVFLPLAIMLIVWIKLGANISNFPFSLGAIVFHLGLGAIFVLYYLFFVSLNMFTTLKLLALIGGLTFLGGNSLLSNIAARRGKRSATEKN